MAKAGELDWSELYDKTNNQKLEKTEKFDWFEQLRNTKGYKAESKVEPKPLLKNDDVPMGLTNEQIAEYILRGVPRQPTNEEMFGHLVVTEDMAKKAQEDFETKINDFYKAASKPLGPPTNAFGLTEDWEPGGSFLDSLSESERREYLSRQKEIDSHDL